MRCLRNWNPENKETAVPAWIADGLGVKSLWLMLSRVRVICQLIDKRVPAIQELMI